jgi:hypothetical protein
MMNEDSFDFKKADITPLDIDDPEFSIGVDTSATSFDKI